MRTIEKKPNLLGRKTYYAFFLLLAWFILIVPLIDTEIIPGHDYVFHVTRILDVADAMKNGIFPVRVYVDEIRFWGAPVGIFYPSLFNYIPVLLKLMGIPVEICYNLFIMLIFILGVFSSWYGFSLLTKSKSIGFFSTILYISSGYYLMDAYIRNALGELLGLSFIPLAMACITIFVTKSKIPVKIYVVGILAISAIIQSHVLSSAFLVLFGLFCLVVRYHNISTKKIFRLFLVSTILLLLNANFIIPFLFFYKNVPVSIAFVDGFAQQGWPTIVIARFIVFWNFWLFIAVYLFLSERMRLLFSKPVISLCQTLFKNKIHSFRAKLYMQYFLTGCLFLLLSDTVFPWDAVPYFKNFCKVMQFPYRFLGIATLCFCVCGGVGIHNLLRKIGRKNVVGVVSVCLICSTSLVAFIKFAPLSSLSYWRMPAKTYWERLISTSDTDYLYKDMDIKKLVEQGDHYISNAVISNYHKDGTNISFSYLAESDSKIILPLVNYPGYLAVDQTGKEIAIFENDNHMMEFFLPRGQGEILLKYAGLNLFNLADFVSLITFVFFCSVSIRQFKHKRRSRLIEFL